MMARTFSRPGSGSAAPEAAAAAAESAVIIARAGEALRWKLSDLRGGRLVGTLLLPPPVPPHAGHGARASIPCQGCVTHGPHTSLRVKVDANVSFTLANKPKTGFQQLQQVELVREVGRARQPRHERGAHRHGLLQSKCATNV